MSSERCEMAVHKTGLRQEIMAALSSLGPSLAQSMLFLRRSSWTTGHRSEALNVPRISSIHFDGQRETSSGLQGAPRDAQSPQAKGLEIWPNQT
jgi:hypothetical protein